MVIENAPFLPVVMPARIPHIQGELVIKKHRCGTRLLSLCPDARRFLQRIPKSHIAITNAKPAFGLGGRIIHGRDTARSGQPRFKLWQVTVERVVIEEPILTAQQLAELGAK